MKKLLSSLLCTLLCALCSTVSAATNYGIKVGGVSVTSDNAANVTGSNIKENVMGRPYYVVYEASTKTLRMYNVKIDRTGSNNRAILNESCDGLTIVFEDACWLKAADASPLRFNANTTIKCLQGTESDTTFVYGVDEDAITVANGATLTIDGACLHVEATNSSAIIGNSSARTEKLYIKNSIFYIAAHYYQVEGAIYNMALLSMSGSSGSTRAFPRNDKLNDHNPGGAPSINNITSIVISDDMKIAHYKEQTISAEFIRDDEFRTGMEWGVNFEKALIPVDAAHFPDANFRSYLLETPYIVKSHLFASDIPKGNFMDIENKEIASLKGIEYFTNLLYLYCENNQLTTLDLSANTMLLKLRCDNNNLTSLDLSKNTSLNYLSASNNQLTTLNVKNCTLLEQLECDNNKLSSLDVSGKEKMTSLECQGNALTSINLSGCTALKSLVCYSNKLKTIDVSSAGNSLTSLTAYENELTSLDVTANTKLTSLDCSGNKLTALNLSQNKQLETLKCYDNRLTALNLLYTVNLTFISCYSNQITGDAMTEFVSGLPPQTSTKVFYIVNHDSPAEGNEITAEQVATAKNRGWLPCHYYNNDWYDTKECLLYDIWIKSRRVTNHGTQASGTTYDHATKTLTLTNANIQGKGAGTGSITDRGYGIYCEEPGVTIDVKGTCTVAGDVDNQALVLYGTNTNPSKATITGNGTLNLKSNIEAIYDSGTNDTLTIGGNVTVEAEGSIYGYSRRVPGRERVYYNSLLIKDKATVKAKSSDCGIYSWKELLLKDRHEIIAPEGAYWDAENHYVSYADGTTVGDEWITIAVEELTSDLNNDGKISTADIQIIINEMKKAQASQNMAYDLNGDGKISTADIQVIINEMKK